MAKLTGNDNFRVIKAWDSSSTNPYTSVNDFWFEYEGKAWWVFGEDGRKWWAQEVNGKIVFTEHIAPKA